MSNTSLSHMTTESIYLEYLNDWLTVAAMAEHYGKTIWGMQFLINAGRDEHIKNLSKKSPHNGL